MKEHIKLSEKSEDLQEAANWGKEQKEKRRRNDEAGKRLWVRIFPILKTAVTAK